MSRLPLLPPASRPPPLPSSFRARPLLCAAAVVSFTLLFLVHPRRPRLVVRTRAVPRREAFQPFVRAWCVCGWVCVDVVVSLAGSPPDPPCSASRQRLRVLWLVNPNPWGPPGRRRALSPSACPEWGTCGWGGAGRAGGLRPLPRPPLIVLFGGPAWSFCLPPPPSLPSPFLLLVGRTRVLSVPPSLPCRGGVGGGWTV